MGRIALLLGLVLVGSCREEGLEEGCSPGHKLYLSRQAFPTFRACIFEPRDCQFVADILQKEEPKVRWYCQ